METVTVKWVIFDVGGVLIRSCSLDEILGDVAKGFGVDIGRIREVYMPLIKPLQKGDRYMTHRGCWEKLSERLSRPIPNDWEEILARRFIRDLKENREVFDIIDDVKDAGYGVAILSNTIWPHVNHHLESGHYKQFEKMNIFLSCEIGMVKEDPGTFSFVIDRLRAAPEECMFVDDVEDYLKVARGLGIGTALFNDAAQLRSDLASAGVDI